MRLHHSPSIVQLHLAVNDVSEQTLSILRHNSYESMLRLVYNRNPAIESIDGRCYSGMFVISRRIRRPQGLPLQLNRIVDKRC